MTTPTPTEDAVALLEDPDVCQAAPIACLQCWRPVLRRGGAAWLPWRSDALRAVAAGVSLVDSRGALPSLLQAAVLAGKSRAATLDDCLQAWTLLPPGGRLLLVGGNDVGIRSSARRLAGRLQVDGRVLANRARARVIACTRPTAPAADPPPDPPPRLTLPAAATGLDADLQLHSAHGVFSADRLDAGSALLLRVLQTMPPAGRILDIGAGIGVLGLVCLRRWPEKSTACLLEADARAVACARANAASLGVERRAGVHWWDVSEPVPAAPAPDLVLINPPCHVQASTAFGTDAALGMIRQALAVTAPGGRILVVANRRLGYEGALQAAGGVVERLAEDAGFKVLQVVRPRR